MIENTAKVIYQLKMNKKFKPSRSLSLTSILA